MKNRILEIEEILQDVIGKLVILSGNAFFMEGVLRKLTLETKTLLIFIIEGGLLLRHVEDEGEPLRFRRTDEFQGLLDRVKRRVEYAEEMLDE